MPSVSIATSLAGPNDETFKILDFLGRGAFGEVYRAVGEKSGMVVAVKLLPIGILSSEASQLALLNEIGVAQQVIHPNVVQVVYVNDGKSSAVGPYVFMEYVSGGTLAKLLRAQKQSGSEIPLNRGFEMMMDIAQGARAINEKVIHRDIKPDNILVEGSRLKIGDFGISKFVDESTRLHTFKGGQHVAYMAPEGWQNQRNTPKLDLYSVGLIFYEILTLHHPLLSKVRNPDDPLDWERAHLYQQCQDARSLRKETPLSVAQLLSRMVSKRADDRPPWSEVLTILSQPNLVQTGTNPSVAAAVEAAVARQQREESKQLAQLRQQQEREKQLGLYRCSFDMLLEQFNAIIEDFNRKFQYSQITCDSRGGFTTYEIPSGRSISIALFAPVETPIKVRVGEVVGGGWIGVRGGRSANLVLLRHAPEDLYGRWVVCEIGIMALTDPRKLIGQFGITKETVLPFGFRDNDFYGQIAYAAGGLHVFTYNFIDNVGEFFASMIHEACK